MNINNNSVSLTSADDLRQLISPLAKHHINYFSYTKAFANGSQSHLTTNPDHLKAWYADELYFQGNGNAKIDLYENIAALYSTFPNQYPVKWCQDNFNIAHGIHIIRNNTDYCEFYSFATTSDHPETQNLYLNHLDLFEQLCHYFKSKFAELISLSEQQIISTPSHNKPILPNHLEDVQRSKQLFNHEPIPTFSKQQTECIRLLLQSQSSKSIAYELNLSIRTVEKYIEAIKFKLTVRTKSELISKLHYLSVNRLL